MVEVQRVVVLQGELSLKNENFWISTEKSKKDMLLINLECSMFSENHLELEIINAKEHPKPFHCFQNEKKQKMVSQNVVSFIFVRFSTNYPVERLVSGKRRRTRDSEQEKPHPFCERERCSDHINMFQGKNPTNYFKERKKPLFIYSILSFID